MPSTLKRPLKDRTVGVKKMLKLSSSPGENGSVNCNHLRISPVKTNIGSSIFIKSAFKMVGNTLIFDPSHLEVEDKSMIPPRKPVTTGKLLQQVTIRNRDWKINRFANQLQQLFDDELTSVQRSLNNMLTVLERDISPISALAADSTLFGNPIIDKFNVVDRICFNINAMMRGNLQRSQVILDKYMKSKQQVLSLVADHQDQVVSHAKRLANKRICAIVQ